MTVLNLVVAASADDAHQLGTGAAGNITNATVGTLDSDAEWGGWRWTGFSIPQGSTINSCTAQIDFNSSGNDEPLHNLNFEYAAAPPEFTTGLGDLENRTLTGSPVLWDSANLGAVTHAAGGTPSFHTSPSLVTPLQLVVDDFTVTTIVLIAVQPTTDTARDFTGHSWDADAGHVCSAKLDIDYTAPVAAAGKRSSFFF